MYPDGPNSSLSVSVIAGDQDRAVFICEALRARGLDARAADFADSCDVVLFDLASCPPKLAAEMADHAASLERRPVTASLGIADAGASPDVDIRFSSDAALAAAKARIEFALRAAGRRAEAELRTQTLESFGCPPVEDAAPSSTKRALFVGDAGAMYPTLNAGLGAGGLTLAAAFSSYSAFDYLHDDDFAAVIVDGGAEWLKAGAFCAMVRRSPSLADLPVVAILPSNVEPSEDVLAHATDVVESDAPADFISRQIIDLVDASGPSARQFSKPVGDAADDLSALFSRPFFEAHLARQIEWSEVFAQPLTMIAFRVRTRLSGVADADIAHAAHVVTSLLRAQDVPARLSDDIIGVSMPGSTFTGAHGAARRIAGVLDATAFEGGSGEAGQIGLDWRIAERRRGQDVDAYLKSALDGGPFERSAAA